MAEGRPKGVVLDMFSVRIEVTDHVAICRVQGDVDAASAPELRETMAALAAFRAVVMDFSGVPFIDSAGLGALIAGARRIRDAGGDIAVCSTRRAVGRLLQTVGMESVLRITPTVADAITALRSPTLA